MTLERGHTSNLTLIFEVRYKPVDRCTRPFSRLLESDRPSLSEPPVPVALTLRSRLPLGTQDGYPKGSFVAMSDDDRDETAIARLNAEVADRAGSLTLKDAVAAIGRVFDCEEDARRVVEACIDAPGDDKVGGGGDGFYPATSSTPPRDPTCPQLATTTPHDDDCHAYSDEDDPTPAARKPASTPRCPASSTPTSSSGSTRTSASAWNGRNAAWRRRRRTMAEGGERRRGT